MLFDIRTPDTAYYFLQEFLGITFSDFIHEYIIECNKDFDKFWDKWLDHIETINIDHLEYIVLHVTSNADNCLEIKTNGIKNLQLILSDKTNLSSLLLKHNIQFDVEKRILYANKKIIDIDYEKYRSKFDLSYVEKKINRVAHKIYYDHQINGFFSNNDVCDYGTSIHQRPEFLYNLIELFPQLREIENEWIERSKGYIVTFRATFDQFAWFSFYENEYNYIDDVSDKLQLKKWVLSQVINRSFDNNDSHSEIIAYMKPETIIIPEQIIDYQEII